MSGIFDQHGRIIERTYNLVTDLEVRVEEVVRKTNQVTEQLGNTENAVNLNAFLLNFDQYVELVEHFLDQISVIAETVLENIRKAARGQVDSKLLSIDDLQEVLGVTKTRHWLAPFFEGERG